MMTLTGTVWKYNGELCFCPDLIMDIHMGKPNDAWIEKNAGAITNIKSFMYMKEGTAVVVSVEQYYDTSLASCLSDKDQKEYKESFKGFMYKCKIDYKIY